MRKMSLVKKLALALTLGFTLQGFAYAQTIPSRAYQHKAAVIREARQVWGPEANVALFAAQFHQESAWNNNAVSHVGARGMGQFMPATAREVHQRYPELRQLEMYSTLWSIRALHLYDKQLYDAIKPMQGTKIHDCSRYAMMLSAYNGGGGWLNRDRRLARDAGKNPDRWWDHVELYTARAAWARKENRDYPIRIMLRHTPAYLAAGYPGVNVCQTD